jgi:tetratricopeptide (TPR) repeat protein
MHAAMERSFLLFKSNQARRSQGQDAIDLLGQSIAGYKAELTVFTKDRFPQRWARTEDSLGNALAMQGARMSGNESHETLTQAAAAYRAALEVFTKEGYPPRWMQAQLTLGTVLGTLTFRTTGSESDELLKQAITAYSGALELLTPDINAEQWVRAEASLGELLAVQGQRSGNDATESFRQSAAAYENALRVSPTDAAILSALGALYHEFLIDFGKAYKFAQRAAKENPNESNQLNLAEAALTTSHFSECLEALTATNEAQLEDRLVPARRTFLLACQWGAGQKKEAAQTAESFSNYVVGLPKGGWTTSGDRKYLGTAEQFRLERPLWIELFQSLQDNDGQLLAQAANNLHSAMVK